MTPTFAEFLKLARTYNLIAISKECVVDRVTPVSVYERLQAKEPYAFLLESVEGGERFGRYSFVGQRPHAVFTCHGHSITYEESGRIRRFESQNPLKELKSIFSKIKAAPNPHLSRFWGGAVGYWGYDTVRFFENLPSSKRDALSCPTGAFQLSGEIVAFDRFSQTAQVIANIHIPENATSSAALKRLYTKGLRSIDRQISLLGRHRPTTKTVMKSMPPPRPLSQQHEFELAVEKAKDYIRAGDIIQVVLSQRWEMSPKVTPFQVYRALRMVNPSPYMYLLHFPGVDLVGSSPELLVRKEGERAETRPIAGTRRRGESPAEDAALAKELEHDPKERAEHLMLVDLGRNDLGRVCEPGTVQVPELMTIERYSHVMHLVSSVTGQLSASANAFDLFQACFPAGTVSGAPKVRAMQIIDELEPVRRGPYAGSIGYYSYTGDMDMAITIRTLVFCQGKAYMQAGAGIVADSVPEREFRECQQKAAALFAAVQMAQELV